MAPSARTSPSAGCGSETPGGVCGDSSRARFDRARAKPLALASYGWLAARLEKDRVDARARMARRWLRRKAERERAIHDGLGGVGFPFGATAVG